MNCCYRCLYPTITSFVGSYGNVTICKRQVLSRGFFLGGALLEWIPYVCSTLLYKTILFIPNTHPSIPCASPAVSDAYWSSSVSHLPSPISKAHYTHCVSMFLCLLSQDPISPLCLLSLLLLPGLLILPLSPWPNKPIMPIEPLMPIMPIIPPSRSPHEKTPTNPLKTVHILDLNQKSLKNRIISEKTFPKLLQE